MSSVHKNDAVEIPDNVGIDHLKIELRDYFAAKAISLYFGDCITYEVAAKEAYEVADAMMKVRKL